VQTLHTWPERIHDGQPFESGWRRELGLDTCIQSADKQEIRWINRTDHDPHAHLALSGLRKRSLLDGKNIGRFAVSIESDGLHLADPLSVGGRRTVEALRRK
jgi:hypothetical protein